MKPKVSTFDELLQELSQDPEFSKEYRMSAPFYDLVVEFINRRKELGLTQKELAERAGTHQSTVSRVESADQDVRISTLIQLAEALESQVKLWLHPYSKESPYSAEEVKNYQRFFNITGGSQHQIKDFREGPEFEISMTRM